MDIVDSFILGIIQGITEFLPVSSSGHLVVMEHILTKNAGISPSEIAIFREAIMFNITLHFATLLATLIVFRKDIIQILASLKEIPHLFKREKRSQALENPYFRLIIMIIIATIPTGLIAVLFKLKLIGDHSIYEYFQISIYPVGICFLITGIMLILTKFIKTGNGSGFKEIKGWQSFLVGTAQGIGILQGISRSGSTISMGLFTGLNRDIAGRFAFLISIPAIAGAMLLEGFDYLEFIKTQETMNQVKIGNLITGFLTAFVFGWASLRLLLRFLREGKFFYFGFYCLAAGLFTLIYILI